MEKRKIFWDRFKYLIVGGVMGVTQQFAGRLDYILYKGRDIFSFSQIMGGLSIYAAIILFVIKREVKPKRQLHDLFLFFLGLDFFYYLYCFFLDLARYLMLDSHPEKLSVYFQASVGEVADFIKWTIIGTAAGFWALGATKLRNGGRTRGYRLMLAPLFGVIGLELADSAVNSVRYFADRYKVTHIEGYPETIISLPIASLLTALTALILCIRHYRRKPSAEN